jgi:hypothetical protein
VGKILGSNLFSASACALIWIIISFATGGTALFSLGGGIALGVIVYVIGYAIRRLVLDRGKAAT